jgi:hypothetical protein
VARTKRAISKAKEVKKLDTLVEKAGKSERLSRSKRKALKKAAIRLSKPSRDDKQKMLDCLTNSGLTVIQAEGEADVFIANVLFY